MGYVYVIVGYSGSGKSTLLHLIASFLPASSGKIMFNDRNITKADVTLILQQPHFLGDLSLKDNINLVNFYTNGYKGSKLQQLAAIFHIDKILNRKTNVCSGGEKARANIVRGVTERKRVVLIDEPTAHLDLENAKLAAEFFSKLAKKRIVIVTTHQPSIFIFPNTILINLKNGSLVNDEVS